MRKIAAMLLTLALGLCLCACGGAGGSKGPPDGGEKKTAEDSGLVGVYKMVGLVSDGEDVSEDLAMMDVLGMRAFLHVEEGGKARMETFGEVTDLTWDEAYFSAEGEPVSYTLEGDTLTLRASDKDTMTFQRLTEEELADYQENGSNSLQDLLDSLDGFRPEIPQGKPSEGPVTGDINGDTVTVLGAEAFQEDGASYLRFYYTYTNGGQEANSAYMALYVYADQDGEPLTAVEGLDNAVPEDENAYMDIEPGQTARCTMIYEFHPDGGTVGILFTDADEEQTVLYYADPASLSEVPS